MLNADRAGSVDPALQDLARNYGLIGEDPITIAGDVICNILHWVAQKEGIEAAMEAALSGLSHFAIEYAAGPSVEAADGDCHVQISLHGHGYSVDGGDDSDPEPDQFWLKADTYAELEVEGFVQSRAAFKVVHG